MSKQELLTKKEFKIQEKRVMTLAKKWMNLLLLDHWEIKISPENSIRSDDEPSSYQPQDVNGYWECVMSTASDPWYMQATIYAYLPIIKDLSDDRVEETLVHEFMHIYLSPMVGKHKKEEELVATALARTLVRMNENEYKNKKPR